MKNKQLKEDAFRLSPPPYYRRGQQSCLIMLWEFRYIHAAKAPQSFRLHSHSMMHEIAFAIKKNQIHLSILKKENETRQQKIEPVLKIETSETSNTLKSEKKASISR